MKQNFTLADIQAYAQQLEKELGMPERHTLEEVYESDEYDCCRVYYVTVEDPELIADDRDDVDDLVEASSDFIYENLAGPYAYEDCIGLDIDRLAMKLSEKFKNVLFAISSDFYEHGDPNDECSGEYVSAYVNGEELD